MPGIATIAGTVSKVETRSTTGGKDFLFVEVHLGKDYQKNDQFYGCSIFTKSIMDTFAPCVGDKVCITGNMSQEMNKAGYMNDRIFWNTAVIIAYGSTSRSPKQASEQKLQPPEDFDPFADE